MNDIVVNSILPSSFVLNGVELENSPNPNSLTARILTS